MNNKLILHDVESKDQVSVDHFFSNSNITSDWKRKIEIKLFIQNAFASGSRLMGIRPSQVNSLFLVRGRVGFGLSRKKKKTKYLL